MIRDRIYDYYINKDYNCAESLLHAANNEYVLNIPEDAFKLVGGFGAGMGCGKTCGVLCSGISAIGFTKIIGRAHATEDLGGYCTEYVTKFVMELGSDQCDVLVKTFKNDDTRCLNAVLAAADVLESVLAKIKKRDVPGDDIRK